MELDIVFTDQVSEMLISISLFIEQNWSLKQADKFIAKAYKTFDLLSKNPFIFKASSIN